MPIPNNYITGNYSVGTECFTVTDGSRQEMLGEATGNRKIAVRMYYPVNQASTQGKNRSTIFRIEKKQQL